MTTGHSRLELAIIPSMELRQLIIITLDSSLIVPRVLRAINDVVVSTSELPSIDTRAYVFAVIVIRVFDLGVYLFKNWISMQTQQKGPTSSSMGGQITLRSGNGGWLIASSSSWNITP
jgi:hypothetical protein